MDVQRFLHGLTTDPHASWNRHVGGCLVAVGDTCTKENSTSLFMFCDGRLGRSPERPVRSASLLQWVKTFVPAAVDCGSQPTAVWKYVIIVVIITKVQIIATLHKKSYRGS